VRLKLLSPLGVLRHVLDRNLAPIETRRTVVHEDARVLRSVRDQLEAYTTEMRTDSERYLLELRASLGEVERRGRTWLERNIRVGNINLLRNRDAVENRFRNEVVADAPREIEDVVQRMVDWTVRRNLKLWTAVFAELDAHTARLRASGALAAHATPSSSTTARSCSPGCASRSSAGSATSTPRRGARGGRVDARGGDAGVRRQRAGARPGRRARRGVHHGGARRHGRAHRDAVRDRRAG
jgi:hypothetical protein